MYVRREKSWLKHLDFGILDIISIIVEIGRAHV